jgi:hypothetical protein
MRPEGSVIRLRFAATPLFLATVAFACAGSPLGTEPPPPPPPGTIMPLTQLTTTYFGLPGGLYPDGTNEPPADHAAAGHAALARIEPLNTEGLPDPNGKIVMVSVGMSNTTQEFCSQGGASPCTSWSFMGQAEEDPAVDRTHLVIVNGANGGAGADTWDEPDDGNYDRVNRTWLQDRNLTVEQIQIAWVKQALPHPTVSLPAANANAYELEQDLGEIVRAMKVRWPNLRIVFFSSRTYGGYATTTTNPEPFAYETAFSARGVIEAQIVQARTGAIDAQSGDVGLAGGAPWLAWGPYLWADGETPRADGLVWLRSDFGDDGTHPSVLGERKVGTLLLDFLKSSPFAQCWFLAGRSC